MVHESLTKAERPIFAGKTYRAQTYKGTNIQGGIMPMAIGRAAAWVLCCLTAAVAGTPSRGAEYPTHPVRIVIGFGAGASADTPARLLAQKFSDALGQQFIVENKPGAGSNVAAEYVAHAPADGYTLFL